MAVFRPTRANIPLKNHSVLADAALKSGWKMLLFAGFSLASSALALVFNGLSTSVPTYYMVIYFVIVGKFFLL